jgi:hypothetical protein
MNIFEQAYFLEGVSKTEGLPKNNPNREKNTHKLELLLFIFREGFGRVPAWRENPE